MFCHWHERRSRRTRQVHPLEQGAGEPGGGQMAAREPCATTPRCCTCIVPTANNELNAAGSSTDAPAPLLGREGAFERGVLRRVQRVQQHAKDMAGERRVQQQQYGVKPEKLVVPSEEHPSSMFDPGTWAMAYPDLFSLRRWCSLLGSGDQDNCVGGVPVPIMPGRAELHWAR